MYPAFPIGPSLNMAYQTEWRGARKPRRIFALLVVAAVYFCRCAFSLGRLGVGYEARGVRSAIFDKL